MLSKKEKLSIIIPVFNEEDCLPELFKRLLFTKKNLEQIGVDVDIIFINDGSIDKSTIILNDYARKQKFVKLIEFSRNFGHQIAITAGIDFADADYVGIIDADLQDPPELFKDMLLKIKEGYDVVYGKRLSRKGESIFKKLSAKLFYRFLNIMCAVEIPLDTGDFRLFNKKVLYTLKTMKEKHRFIRGMIAWIGFNSVPYYYHRDERYAGVTKYSLIKMINFALDAIFSFSRIPLKFAMTVGFIFVIFGFLSGLVILYLKLFTKYYVPGITSVILIVVIMTGIQIIMIGIACEYIGRIFEESKQRPLYIISNKKNF